jgi:formylmethanofuran dehydrogenase subunit E
MPRPTIYSYPLPLPGEEIIECDHCGSDTLTTEAETHEDKCLCIDCQDEITAPES